MSSWHEPTEHEGMSLTGFILIALFIPLAFVGAFELLNYALEELAKVIA